jgi:hypothetical protein
MIGKMKMELICDGELINTHSNRQKRFGGWVNPLEILPPIGSVIEYMTFNQNHKEGQGILTKYLVKSYSFYTEEDFNSMYRGHACKVFVDKLEPEEEKEKKREKVTL